MVLCNKIAEGLDTRYIGESSVIEFSEQGERTLRSVESSVIEFSEQGERTSDSLENEGIELPFFFTGKIKLQELHRNLSYSELYNQVSKILLQNGDWTQNGTLFCRDE
ncbi:hypothetical protein [Leptospira santarosai]|uniref:hypothetical protein n=1 Tax=Leptospira santarosai TaxID=28183 RepID=UPI0026E28C59|nr:hypothetical protein [Leptospira santarosai]MDO6384083.1 hypothetical protein [Leptospira santarosai]